MDGAMPHQGFQAVERDEDHDGYLAQAERRADGQGMRHDDPARVEQAHAEPPTMAVVVDQQVRPPHRGVSAQIEHEQPNQERSDPRRPRRPSVGITRPEAARCTLFIAVIRPRVAAPHATG